MNGNVTEYVYSSDGTKLKTIHRTAVNGIDVDYGSTKTLTKEETQNVDSIIYFAGFEIYKKLGDARHFYDGGYIALDMSGHCSKFLYVKDHLGNVRAVVDGDGRVVQSNAYYPYGGLAYVSDNTMEMNRMQHRKFEGKELDRMHGLDVYDYAARQYDAAICQFTSIDPLCEDYYHISPYAYCAGNPVKYVDPDGRKLILTGTDNERKSLLEYLQSLTNNVLLIDKNGLVTIGKGVANAGHDFSVGTGLIADIISNKHTLTMKSGKENCEDSNPSKNPLAWANNDGTPRSGADAVVYIDLEDRQHPKYLVGNNPKKAGEEETKGRPLKIGVAHELVHGLRGMEGVQAHENNIDRYSYVGINGQEKNTQDSAEELRTVGITGNYRYTENKIRREHGLKERRMYNPIK